MGKPIFITDPAVAAAYHVHPAQFVFVESDVEAEWLVANHHGYPLNNPTPLPAAYYVHADAPDPFVPFPDLDPPNTQPAKMTVTISAFGGTFQVTFGGEIEPVAATGRFVVLDTEGVILASGTYAQPGGTTFDAAAGLLQAALVPFAADVAVVKTGPMLELTGVGLNTLGAVAARLTVPRVAADPSDPPAPPPPPPAPPPPAPAPGVSLQVGPEDTHTKIDLDGDGKTDVHVIVDRPPQSP